MHNIQTMKKIQTETVPNGARTNRERTRHNVRPPQTFSPIVPQLINRLRAPCLFQEHAFQEFDFVQKHAVAAR
jgi:hypothetical protein